MRSKSEVEVNPRVNFLFVVDFEYFLDVENIMKSSDFFVVFISSSGSTGSMLPYVQFVFILEVGRLHEISHGEDPELVQLMDQEIQTKRTREDLESDNEENPISKQPKNQEAGWRKPEEQHPTTSKNTTNMKETSTRITLSGMKIQTKETNTTGTNITKWLSQNNVLLLTPRNLITRIDPKTAKESTLDLVFGSPALSHLQIKSASHQISDHLPIIIMDNTYIENHLLKEKKWYYTKERWKDYQKELNETNLEEISTIEEITEQIKNTALKYLKLETRQIIDKPNKPWWNKDCHETIKERNKAFNRWRKKPTIANQIEYKKLSAKAKQTITQQKKKSWNDFCETLNFKNPPKKIWNFFKKLTGKTITTEYPIIDNDLPLTNINQKLEKFKRRIYGNRE
nr:uncharacterized protein LOC113824138 [Penaeus vannamei]